MTSPARMLGLFAMFAAFIAAVSAQTPDIADIQRKAAAGDAKAQFDLAKAYSDGVGVPKDPQKALEWMRKSAVRGYAGAEVILGYMCLKGIEMQQDSHQAAEWYRKAARQADLSPQNAQNAKTHLSEMLAQGLISKKEAEWAVSKPTGGEPGLGKEKVKETEKNNQRNEPPPFSLAEVETGLTGGITSKRMATLVGAYGVNFSLSAATQKRLVDQGADDTLIAVISASKH
jgi:hypothetical protein